MWASHVSVFLSIDPESWSAASNPTSGLQSSGVLGPDTGSRPVTAHQFSDRPAADLLPPLLPPK